jgi:hypothetical protein
MNTIEEHRQYQKEIEHIIGQRYHLGNDLWTTSDHRLIKGSPFSTLECVSYLLELGMLPVEPIMQECAELIFSTWQPDGRFRLSPHGTSYPCQTIHALNVLCQLGFHNDVRLQVTMNYLLATQYQDGGWRCNKFSYGHGPETDCSNPFPTLIALNAFRYTKHYNNPQLALTIEFLLAHWDIRQPIGPCHYGIGTQFMQVEYPFRSYNLFNYVYVLSFYHQAHHDQRFLAALACLNAKLVDGKIIVERNVPKLAQLAWCRKGSPCTLATLKYQTIINNINQETSINSFK